MNCTWPDKAHKLCIPEHCVDGCIRQKMEERRKGSCPLQDWVEQNKDKI